MAARSRALALVVLVVLATLPLLGPAVSHGSATDADPTISRTTELALTPEEPGAVDVAVSFTVPDSVSQIRTRLPQAATEVQSEGFENIGNTTWEWERGEGSPTLQFTLDANVTGSAATLPRTHEGPGFLFVDTGDWALVDVPRMPTQWLRSGPPVSFEDEVTIQGEGATGGEMAYLGPYDAHTRTAHGQTFRLIVPEEATLGPTASAVLDSLAHASDMLRVGERDPEVVMFAVPEDLSWGARGLAGGSDAWVVADESLDQAFNPWIHEYVHTRQEYLPTVETRWTVEATATYYATLFTLQQDLIDYDTFRAQLARGTESPVSETVLEAPASWRGGTPYLKGSLVWGTLDYRLRQATDGQRAAAAVLSAFNEEDDRVTETDFLETVEQFGGTQVAELLARYTQTEDTPETWSAEAHSETFGTEPARFAYEAVGTPVSVSGPYRNVSGLPSAVVVGETISVTVEVTNLGDIQGTYETPFQVNGRTIEILRGTLVPGASQRITTSYTFEEAGVVTVTLGSVPVDVRVAEPAKPSVTSLSANVTTLSGPGTVAVTVTFSNEEDWPAGAEVPVTVDNETVTTLEPRLPPGNSETTTVTLTLSEPGTHAIAIGDRNVSVAVQESGASGPGYGVVPTVVALLVLVAVLTRRASDP